jgi:hypothetical protein
MKHLLIALVFLAACTEPQKQPPQQLYSMSDSSSMLAGTGTGTQYLAFDNFDDTAYNYYTYWEGGFVVHPGGAPVLSQYLSYKSIMHTRSMQTHRVGKLLLDSAYATDTAASWYLSGLDVHAGPGFDAAKRVKITKR